MPSTPGNAQNITSAGVVTFDGTSSFSGSAVTQYAPVVGGASNAVATIAVGSTNQVLQSSGAGVNPAWSTATFPSTAVSTGTILRADGTNWSATTATYPATTTSQQILYSTAANVIGQLTTANSKFPATNSSGTLAMRALSVTRQVFTSSGTYTPTAGMLYCDIIAIGGGGGGGGTAAGGATSSGAAGGGGAGGYAQGTFSASSIGASQTVTIGAAGAAGNAGNNAGGGGGTTSVGSLISATGGSGGTGSSPASVQAASGGAGGAGSNGDFQVNGQNGGVGWGTGLSTNPLAISGFGGNSVFGAGGGSSGSAGAAVAGGVGTSYGAGGSGAAVGTNNSTAAGGAGTKGIVIVTEYIIA